MQKEREIALFNLRGEQISKMNDYEKKVARLEREVDKYQTLAAIEELTRKAKRDLDTSPISPACDLKSFLSSSSQVSESLVPRSRYSQTDQIYSTSTFAQTDCRVLKDCASSPIKELSSFNQKSIKPLIQPVSPIPQQATDNTVRQAVVKPLSSEEKGIEEIEKAADVITDDSQDLTLISPSSAPTITISQGIVSI